MIPRATPRLKRSRRDSVEPLAPATAPPPAPVSAPPIVGFAPSSAQRPPPRTDDKIDYIAVELLVPTRDNPRRLRTDTDDFRSLVESIRTAGILQPLVARPFREALQERSGAGTAGVVEVADPEDKYDLRAGHRRLAAAKAAGLARVPVIVRSMDDKTAMEVTVTENLQREDLRPLEEADGVQRLLDVGWEIRAIADRLGKPASWVARRAKLRDLSPKWRKAIDDPKSPVSAWPANLLDRIARLPAAAQDNFYEHDCEYGVGWDGPIPSERELDRLIADFLCALDGAPFARGDALLVPKSGSCNDCTKRSGAQPLLFEGLTGDNGKKNAGGERCLDRACYQAKCHAVADRALAKLKSEHGRALPVYTGGISYTDEKALAKRFPGAKHVHSGSLHDSPGKGRTPCVIIGGDNLGHTRWYSENGHGGGGRNGHSKSASAKKAPGKPRPMKERRAELEARRFAHAIAALRDRLDTEARKPVGTDLTDLAVSAICGENGPYDAARMCALAAAFGTDRKHHFRRPDEWSAFKKIAADSIAAPRSLFVAVLPVLSDRLQFYDLKGAAQAWKEAQQLAETCNWGELLRKLHEAAIAAIPEPKSWAHLNADGTPKSLRPKKTGGKGDGATASLREKALKAARR